MKELNKFIKQQEKAGELKIYNMLDYELKLWAFFINHNVETWGNHFFIDEKERKTKNKKYISGESENWRAWKTRVLDQLKIQIRQNPEITSYYSADFYTLKK